MAGAKKVAEILKDEEAEMQLAAVAKAARFPKKNSGPLTAQESSWIPD